MIVLEEEVSYVKTRVIIGYDIADSVAKAINGKALLVRQRAVDPKLVTKGIKEIVDEIVLPGGEHDKSLGTALGLVKAFYERGLSRSDFVVAVGGGTLMDVVGFAASIYMRGLKLVNAPTTLLAMVDAAVGGKNAVNFMGVKNVIGTIYQPALVASELRYLDMLTQKEFVRGLSEVVKYSVVLDRELYYVLLKRYSELLNREPEVVEDVVFRSSMIKLSVVKQDPYDVKGVRLVLNFGHTIGHAIEAASGFAVSHGDAVAVGMVCEALLGFDLGYTPGDVVKGVRYLLELLGLPISLKGLGVPLEAELVAKFLALDKKRKGDRVVMPVPTGIGSWTSVEVEVNRIARVCKECLR